MVPKSEISIKSGSIIIVDIVNIKVGLKRVLHSCGFLPCMRRFEYNSLGYGTMDACNFQAHAQICLSCLK